MRKGHFQTVVALTFVIAIASPSAAQDPLPGSAEDALAATGATSVREVASDIALPANSAEYEALGKNAVLMLDASSALASELPLRSAYVVVNDVRVPLQRISMLPAEPVTVTRGGKSENYTRQVAFYLLPIYLLSRDAHLKVDFNGRRDGFGISRFNAATLAGAPTFIRADDYGYPSEPNISAVRSVIVREFPSSARPSPGYRP